MLRQAETEGLTLLRVESNISGLKIASAMPKSTSTKPLVLLPVPDALPHPGPAPPPGVLAPSIVHDHNVAVQQHCASVAERKRVQSLNASRFQRHFGNVVDKRDRRGRARPSRVAASPDHCVSYRSGRCKPYQADVRRGGKTFGIGNATAEEAALAVARDSGAQAAAPQPPSSSSRKRKIKSEEQPPDMPPGARVKLEEEPPPMPNDAVVKLELSHMY